MVKVAEDRQRTVMTVIFFPGDFVLETCHRCLASGARTLLTQLGETLTPCEPRRCYG
jgi:hypothetical protein